MSTVEYEQSEFTPAAGSMMPARFTVEQFDAMIEAGVFPNAVDQKMQLLRGEIVFMTPPNPLHDDVVNLANIWANSAVSVHGEFEPHCQTSMDITATNTVVLPDVMFVHARSYSRQRPTADDTLLLIEVSDTSLTYDLGEKMRLYAEAGVPEYWVVDIPHRSLIVHLDPFNDRYRSVQTCDEHQPVESRMLAGVMLVVGNLFR